MPRGGGTLAIDPVSQLQGRHAPCARNAALRVQQRMDDMRRSTYG